jgi:hypothetical protein
MLHALDMDNNALAICIREGKKKEKTTGCIWRGSMGILCQLILEGGSIIAV